MIHKLFRIRQHLRTRRHSKRRLKKISPGQFHTTNAINVCLTIYNLASFGSVEFGFARQNSKLEKEVRSCIGERAVGAVVVVEQHLSRRTTTGLILRR